MVIGWVFAFFYALAFQALGLANGWLGALFGGLHGLFLLAVFLPLLAAIHPRMASEYDGPSPLRGLEPPVPFGLHYGIQTPLITMAGQMAYGLVMGIFYPL